MGKETLETTLAFRISQVPWPDSTRPHLVEKFEDFRDGKKPVYYAIGEIIQEELDQLQKLVFLKERTHKESYQRDEELWEVFDGYQELEARTDWAMMLEETDGDVENHPSYIATFGKPLLGVHFGGWSSTASRAEFYLFNQRILQIAIKDQTGRKLLRSKEKELEGITRRVGVDLHTSGRMLGFRQARRRYNQILNYLIQNESVV